MSKTAPTKKAAPAKKAASKAPATELQIVPSASAELINQKHHQNEMLASAARFRTIQQGLKIHVGQLKILKFIQGLEVNLVRGLHHELYGETRGGQEAKEVPLTPWIEEHLGVPERTARRYHAFFQLVTSSKPEAAKKLIGFWEKWKSAKLKPAPKPKALKPGAKPKKAQLALSPGAQITAGLSLTQEDLQDLLMTADSWGLHELFEVPMKDVTPDPEDPPPSGGDDSTVKVWLDFIKRSMNNEFLKLPKDKLEALQTTIKEMDQKIESVLNKKGVA